MNRREVALLMQRYLSAYSSGLSYSAVILILVFVCVTVSFHHRATWSGEAAPDTWTTQAKHDDIFVVPGREVAYWGRPDVPYSKYATKKRRKPIAVVVHHTRVRPVKSLVTYGHYSDPSRGGAAFGYHFYVGREGHIVQGAPLSRRTNHIKFSNNKQRRKTARHLWSGNTIAVSLVGGCDALLRPDWRAWQSCTEEYITEKQLKAGLAVVRSLQAKFGMKCSAVYGHGDLQFDREGFEGTRLSRLARRVCRLEQPAPPLPVVGPRVQTSANAKGRAESGS